MAKNSFDKEMLTDLDKPIDKLDDLNDEEREALREWSDFFTGKYMIVGSLIEEVETKLGNAI
jgi:membrane-associated progesterone receptor component